MKAFKLVAKRHRCRSGWVGSAGNRCTQVAKYRIGDFYYCTTHAKIRALKEMLDEG